MTEKKTAGVADDREVQSLPIASVGPARLNSAATLAGSYMWLVALICLLIAIVLVAWSLPERGVAIDIYFPDGHGLKAEDVVRFRGIDVGIVKDVKLNHDLTGVDVQVDLKPFAQSLARDGTRFWIVRPELSLAGISGLETAVGNKYIGLIPGDADADFRNSFEGLSTSPSDALASGGMEIIIRGERQQSINAGSPVSCRGVEIGRILSVGLSQDARFVDIRARIFEKYIPLISTKTKFWATSGVKLDFSFSDGLKIDVESLETLTRGGLSMLTTDAGGQPAKPGDVFPLYSQLAEEWYAAANLVSATNVKLRGVLPLEINWNQKGMLRGESTKQATVNGIPIRDAGGNCFVTVPADVLSVKKIVAGTLTLRPSADGDPPISIPDLVSETEGATLNVAPLRNISVPGNFSPDWFDPAAIRFPTVLEECLAVRATGPAKSLTYLHYPIEQVDISESAGGWVLNSFDGDRDVWHGAPILATADGKLIGVLLIIDRQALIVPPTAN